MNRWLSSLLGGLLTVATVLGAAPPAGAAARDTSDWRWLIDRAAQAAEKTAYVGESLLVSYEDGESTVSTFIVQSTGEGQISVVDRSRYALRLGDDGGSVADHERGWFFPLPAADLAKAHKVINRLAAKYDVEVLGADRLLDRPCTRLEIVRRDDRRLVERLWVDDVSGLLLRRETYAGADHMLRMVAYLRLDLNPGDTPRIDQDVHATRGQRPGQARLEQHVADVDEDGRAALRGAGWIVPEELPDQYRIDGSYVVSTGDSQPLQSVYSDGLYTMSLFEQRSGLDPESLPAGAEPTSEFGFDAYTWPGAVPRRVVWEADGVTWSLVGDAPPDEFHAIADTLPQPRPDRIVDRLRRGLSRLWSWVSPWA